MAVSIWLALAGVCLLYVSLGLWAISQIFPTGHDLFEPDPDQHKEHDQS